MISCSKGYCLELYILYYYHYHITYLAILYTCIRGIEVSNKIMIVMVTVQNAIVGKNASLHSSFNFNFVICVSHYYNISQH